jgi:hypothetical protein
VSPSDIAELCAAADDAHDAYLAEALAGAFDELATLLPWQIGAESEPALDAAEVSR